MTGEADKDRLVEPLCRRWCSFFKPGKVEEERCGGYEWLLRALREGRIDSGFFGEGEAPAAPELRNDGLIEVALCGPCAFREDGCDYRDPKGPADALPCGGVIAIDFFLEEGRLKPSDLTTRRGD